MGLPPFRRGIKVGDGPFEEPDGLVALPRLCGKLPGLQGRFAETRIHRPAGQQSAVGAERVAGPVGMAEQPCQRQLGARRHGPQLLFLALAIPEQGVDLLGRGQAAHLRAIRQETLQTSPGGKGNFAHREGSRDRGRGGRGRNILHRLKDGHGP